MYIYIYMHIYICIYAHIHTRHAYISLPPPLGELRPAPPCPRAGPDLGPSNQS